MCCSIFFLFFTTSVKSINKFFKCSNNSKPSVSSFFFSALQNSLLKASVLCSDLNSCFLAWCKLSSWGFLYCSPLLVSFVPLPLCESSHFTETCVLIVSCCLHTCILWYWLVSCYPTLQTLRYQLLVILSVTVPLLAFPLPKVCWQSLSSLVSSNVMLMQFILHLIGSFYISF